MYMIRVTLRTSEGEEKVWFTEAGQPLVFTDLARMGKVRGELYDLFEAYDPIECVGVEYFQLIPMIGF